jgi:hypothetical protein
VYSGIQEGSWAQTSNERRKRRNKEIKGTQKENAERKKVERK